MADISPKVSRALARYLVVLIALLESKRGVLSEEEHISKLEEFNSSLLALSDPDRAALEQFAGALAATLAVPSSASRVLA